MKAIIIKNANLWEAWVNGDVVFSNPSCEQVCTWAENEGYTLDIVPANPQMAMA
jgi:hypothetical protein